MSAGAPDSMPPPVEGLGDGDRDDRTKPLREFLRSVHESGGEAGFGQRAAEVRGAWRFCDVAVTEGAIELGREIGALEMATRAVAVGTTRSDNAQGIAERSTFSLMTVARIPLTYLRGADGGRGSEAR